MSEAKFKIESGMQLLARLTKKPIIQNFYPVLFENGPHSGDIIELSSDCNTSYILIDIICEALFKSNETNGFGVLLFNTDGNLDYNNLLVNLKKKLYTNNALLNSENVKSDSELENLLREILANFHILEIYDATQLYTTIHNLENILMVYSNITLVIFDTLTAFYWSEQSFKITRMDLYVKNLIQCIYKATKEYKITCIFTRPCYFTKHKTENNIDVSALELINCRICLARNIDERNAYQVHVTTDKLQFTKYFHVVDNELKWN